MIGTSCFSFQNESGAATAFISRGKAIKVLQLSLQDFR